MKTPTDPYLKLVLGAMRNLEWRHGTDQVERYVGNLGHVTLPNTHRNTANDDVGVTNCLNLTMCANQWDIILEIVRRFICWIHSRRVYGRVQMMALTSVYGAGVAYKQWNVTSHDFRCSVMYAD